MPTPASPQTVTRPRRDTFVQRVKLVQRGPQDCWNWLWAIDNRGYGRAYVDGKDVPAHRAVWEYFCGKVPPGKQLDHLCRNRCCVNPRHLEPVWQRENVLRGMSPPAQAARKGFCSRGHPLVESNIYRLARGERVCKLCDKHRHEMAKWKKQRRSDPNLTHLFPDAPAAP